MYTLNTHMYTLNTHMYTLSTHMYTLNTHVHSASLTSRLPGSLSCVLCSVCALQPGCGDVVLLCFMRTRSTNTAGRTDFSTFYDSSEPDKRSHVLRLTCRSTSAGLRCACVRMHVHRKECSLSLWGSTCRGQTKGLFITAHSKAPLCCRNFSSFK